MSRKKVMIGMSGGVDSSVAAAVLLEKGYDVIGVTMKIWPEISSNTKQTEKGCCSLSAVDDARNVAYKLGIPYYVMNFQDIFEDKVIDYFKNEYLKGRTPNPCIACNRFVKFEAMLQKAISMDINYVATGHYAIIEYDEILKRYLLKKSVADKKDQTYALYNLTQEQLSKTLLPIGNYTKEHVRKIAEKLELDVASKPDSQEICFVEDNNYARFIKENTDKKIKPGYFIDIKGNVLGKHKGIIHYTVGQRKGLGVTFGKPVYVVGVDVKNNNVILGENQDTFSKSLVAEDLNYIMIDKLENPMEVKVKIRYLAQEAEATIYPMEDGKVKVDFKKPQRAITPGQSVVFYNGDIVVGGGVIK